MNGLEAIKAMEEGKVVIYKALDGDFLNKIKDGIVLVKGIGEPNDAWRVDVSFNFGGLYGEYAPKVTGWERVNRRDKYWYISASICCLDDEINHSGDNLKYRDANYFSIEEKAEEIKFKQTLFRKLQRFSDENCGSEIDWNNYECDKYYIFYNHNGSELEISAACSFKDFGQVYFKTQEIADQAIELFKEDLIKYFTHDWSKGE